MKTFFILATFLLTFSAHAEDYVGRALTTCAPLKGQGGYDKCVIGAGRDICGGLQSPHDRLACHQDFERYYSAQVKMLENKRIEASENTQRLIEQLQRQSQ